jgi:endoglucanase
VALRIRTPVRKSKRFGSVILGAATAALLGSAGCHRKGVAAAPAVGPSDAPLVGGDLIKNSSFETASSIPWQTSFTLPASGSARVEDGALCITIDNLGVQPWDAQLRHREMVAVEGHRYTTSFRIWANQPTLSRLKLGKSGPPYSEYWFQDIPLDSEPKQVRYSFTMRGPTDGSVEFAYHLGGRLAKNAKLPLKVCLDDVHLVDPEFTPAPGEQTEPLSRVRVNQVGYFPKGEKIAVWVSEEPTAKPWRLLGADGQVRASGSTVPLGIDKSSGDRVHDIDFSNFSGEGQGFVLEVLGERSPSFSILSALYSTLKRDALQYFYHNRSGVPIELPFAGDAKWTRPAGHAASDTKVPCGPGAGCNYELDVHGGWYDAGDQGKYVVNGGVAVWTLLNAYERGRLQGKTFRDGELNLPEKGNKVPDLLDEARFELDFLLRMQVPEGRPGAGLVHHKIHDIEWTGLGIRPDQAEKAVGRQLRPVSTAATLNLAAVGAQAARLYRPFDPEFARRALEAAERAYVAAQKEPARYALASDTQGGGPYDDRELDDEFFWAEVELWLSTGQSRYLDTLKKNPYFEKVRGLEAGVSGAFDWRQTELLGKISWLSVQSASENKARKLQEAQIVALGDRYVAAALAEGYRLPRAPDSSGQYHWGSSGEVLNNGLLLGVAFELTHEKKYLRGAEWALDYILGRNGLAQSYVTGYGSRPLRHPHHRFWAEQADPTFPPPPPGAVSGGPNSELQDPYVQAAGLPGCAAQKCFVDHIEAYSVNEVAINWNAPLYWLAEFLDRVGAKDDAR